MYVIKYIILPMLLLKCNLDDKFACVFGDVPFLRKFKCMYSQSGWEYIYILHLPMLKISPDDAFTLCKQ